MMINVPPTAEFHWSNTTPFIEIQHEPRYEHRITVDEEGNISITLMHDIKKDRVR